MHPDIHLQLHRLHAAELRNEAAAAPRAPGRPPGRLLRVQLGWRLVELGLRLATPPHHRAAPLAA
ncbi:MULTISPECIES: hypothetical protein [unclassified Streptomyces]|uniref:hypothetical protein n=1 Tax=unclassified Streptomyces TaxID=2593676 RepID=UPI0036A6D66B